MMFNNTIRIMTLITLTACSSEQNTEVSIQSTVQNLGKAGLSKIMRTKVKAPEQQGQTLSRQMINDSKQQLYLGQIDRPGIVNLFTKTAVNGPYSTFRSPAGISVTMDQGIIVATRGLGLDLISQKSDISAKKMFSAQLKQQPYSRFYRYLLSDNKLVSRHFICIMFYTGIERIRIVGQNYTTRKYIESCQSEVSNFKNQYWVSTGSSKILMSNQMTHPQLGAITLQSLN